MFQSRFPLNDKPGLDLDHDGAESARAMVGVSRLISSLRRQAGLCAGFCLLGLVLGAIYYFSATPLYTATASIIIDNRQVRAIHDFSTLSDSPQQADAAGISAEVDSQIEVLHSEQVGLAVVRHFNLSEDPAFFDPPKTRVGKFLAFLKNSLGARTRILGNGPDAATARQLEALETLNRNLRITRVGRTYVIEVAYSAPDPARAAEIANGYTNAFMLEQMNSRIEATRRARSWLQQRTEELRLLSVNAELDAQKFRADNNLLEAKGTLISEQQFNEMTTQLVTAQADTAQAKARYQHLKTIIDTHQTESAVDRIPHQSDHQRTSHQISGRLQPDEGFGGVAQA